MGHNIQNGLTFMARNFVTDEIASFFATPDLDLKIFRHEWILVVFRKNKS